MTQDSQIYLFVKYWADLVKNSWFLSCQVHLLIPCTAQQTTQVFEIQMSRNFMTCIITLRKWYCCSFKRFPWLKLEIMASEKCSSDIPKFCHLKSLQLLPDVRLDYLMHLRLSWMDYNVFWASCKLKDVKIIFAPVFFSWNLNLFKNEFHRSFDAFAFSY